jgi:arsenate reductase
MTAHWGVFDPAPVEGDEAGLAFFRAFVILERRLKIFTHLNHESLDKLRLERQVRAIGQD